MGSTMKKVMGGGGGTMGKILAPHTMMRGKGGSIGKYKDKLESKFMPGAGGIPAGPPKLPGSDLLDKPKQALGLPEEDPLKKSLFS